MCEIIRVQEVIGTLDRIKRNIFLRCVLIHDNYSDLYQIKMTIRIEALE